MKREEMIDMIVGVLAFLPGYKNTDNHPIEQDAETVLKAVEDAGMAPPEYEPFPGAEHRAVFRQWEK